jgi:ATP-dependent helicase HrpB
LFVAIEVDAGRTEAVVHQASAVERAWLPEQALHTLTEVTFDQATERVLTRRKLLYEDLLIEESLAALPDDDQVTEVLAKAAVEHIERVLPPDDSPAANFLRRVRFLRAWAPELELPGFEREQLKELMPAVCAGARSFAEVQNADWLALLRSRLTVRQLQAIDREAPERLRVPSGNHIALKYEDRRPPVLAVRIQEMFGLQQTPTLAAGRVRVLLHLLGPNYRPQQVTDDLASFWKNTYPRVRKDLRARYPKHAWPEDPLAEPPQSRPRRPR